MIKNRFVAFAVIILIYILAGVCGVYAYDYFSAADGLAFSYPVAIFFADVAATVIVFIFSLIFGNASVYDPYWSVQPPVILLVTFVKTIASVKAGTAAINVADVEVVSGWSFLACMLLTAVFFWAIRLTANWSYNFESFEYQDWRYVMLKEKSGVAYPLINFIGIHMFPTCVVYLCVLPAVTAIVEGAVFRPACALFILISVLAAVFQGIADIQMHRFRKSGVGGFIRKGLWKHSRHPNYACEILMWWGIGLASVVALGGKIWLLSGALINTLMFLFVSIPMADKRQSRKPGFEEYKKETRMLF